MSITKLLVFVTAIVALAWLIQWKFSPEGPESLESPEGLESPESLERPEGQESQEESGDPAIRRCDPPLTNIRGGDQHA